MGSSDSESGDPPRPKKQRLPSPASIVEPPIDYPYYMPPMDPMWMPPYGPPMPYVVLVDRDDYRRPLNYPYARGPYRCRRCGQMKRLHTCTFNVHQRSMATQTFPLSLTSATKMITVSSTKARAHVDDGAEADEDRSLSSDDDEATARDFPVVQKPCTSFEPLANETCVM